jgi:hypothetical protein
MSRRSVAFALMLNQDGYTYELEDIYNSRAEAQSRFEAMRRRGEVLSDSRYRTIRKGERTALYIWW